MNLRLTITLIALLGISTAGSAYSVHQARQLKAQVAGFEACSKAVAGAPGAPSPSSACVPVIAQAHAAAQLAAACDESLATVNGFGVKAACSGPIKRLVAERDAAQGEALAARSNLSTAQASQAAALDRAEARARSLTLKEVQADAALARAPRAGDGRLVCDAECVRQLTQGAGPVVAP